MSDNYGRPLHETWDRGAYDRTQKAHQEIQELKAENEQLKAQLKAKEIRVPDEEIDKLANEFASTPIKDGLFVTSIDMDVAYVAASFGRLLRDHINKQSEGEK